MSGDGPGGSRLGVGVLGANGWADRAHLPGYAAYERCRRVAICDVVPGRARAMADKHGFERAYTDARDLLADSDVGMVDVCTPTGTHAALAGATLATGRHVLCEKPLALSAREAFELADAATAAGVRSKVGFTFRYSAALKQVKAWIEDGTLGEVFHVHGFQQNSQFLDPGFPLRQYDSEDPDGPLVPASIVGYGSHLVDLMRWLAGDFRAVSALMRNFVPERAVRGKEGLRRVPIDDGTVAAVDFRSGAQGLIQTSFVAVGNYPGIEIRVYGSRGAAIARLVTESGVAETLHLARADAVEFREVDLGADRYPPGASVRTDWRELYYRQLVRDWTDEILDDLPPRNTFRDGAMSQQIVDAVVLSHRERRWVDLPVESPLESPAEPLPAAEMGR